MQNKIRVFVLILVFNLIYCDEPTAPEETTISPDTTTSTPTTFSPDDDPQEKPETLKCVNLKCPKKEICMKCNKCPDDTCAAYLLDPKNQSTISCKPGPLECCVCKNNHRRSSDGKCIKLKKC